MLSTCFFTRKNANISSCALNFDLRKGVYNSLDGDEIPRNCVLGCSSKLDPRILDGVVYKLTGRKDIIFGSVMTRAPRHVSLAIFYINSCLALQAIITAQRVFLAFSFAICTIHGVSSFEIYRGKYTSNVYVFLPL